MFRVTTSITGGHEPGEVKPAEAFKGCDLDFLVGNGALVPVGGPAHLTAAPTDPAGLMDEVERLTGELGACREELAAVRSQLTLTAEERDAATAECGALTEANAAVRRDRDALQAERDAAAAELHAVRAERSELLQQVADVRAELTAVRDVIADDPQPKPKKK